MREDNGTDGSLHPNHGERVEQFLHAQAERQEQDEQPQARPVLWPWVLAGVLAVTVGAIAVWWLLNTEPEREPGCAPYSQEVIDNLTF